MTRPLSLTFGSAARSSAVERWALVLAFVAHAGGIAAARLAPAVNLLAVEHARELDLTEIEVDETVKEDVPWEREVVEPTDRDRADPDRQARLDDPRDKRLRARAATGGTGDPGAEEPTGPGDVVDAPEGADDTWSTPEEEGWAPPGTGRNGPIYRDPDLFAMSPDGPPAPSKAPRAKQVDRDAANRVLKDELRKKDKKLGLDLPAAGTVASIFRAAVLASDTPSTARAAFAVQLGPGGAVKAVKFVSSTHGTQAQWEAIAASVKAALNAQKLALTGDYAKGANISVNVQSKMQMPSGAKVDAGLELSLTQTFDVSDIGARPKRVVSASASASPVP